MLGFTGIRSLAQVDTTPAQDRPADAAEQRMERARREAVNPYRWIIESAALKPAAPSRAPAGAPAPAAKTSPPPRPMVISPRPAVAASQAIDPPDSTLIPAAAVPPVPEGAEVAAIAPPLPLVDDTAALVSKTPLQKEPSNTPTVSSKGVLTLLESPPPDLSKVHCETRGCSDLIIVNLTIEKSGRVARAVLALKSSNQLLNERVLAAVANWRYLPMAESAVDVVTLRLANK